jgi:hypothetical protein
MVYDRQSGCLSALPKHAATAAGSLVSIPANSLHSNYILDSCKNDYLFMVSMLVIVRLST